jgi:hypothetical protein
MSSKPEEDPQPVSQNPHWELLRDLVRFQAKLLLDGLRDILMSPLSMVAAIAGTLVDRNRPQALFRQTMDFGQRTERWINLFDRSGQQVDVGEPGIDELFAILEQRVVDQYHRGGATASAKNAIDRSLEGLHRGLDHLKGQSLEDQGDDR